MVLPQTTFVISLIMGVLVYIESRSKERAYNALMVWVKTAIIAAIILSGTSDYSLIVLLLVLWDY